MGIKQLRFLLSPLLFLAVVAAGLIYSHYYRNAVYYYNVVEPLATNVYHEARGESVYGQLMVAYVTVERARENRSYWGGNTIKGVVYHREGSVCQFSWVCDPTTEPVQSGPEWDAAVSAARKVLEGFTPESELKRARYYMNPQALLPADQEWFASLVCLPQVGNHYFFAEPNLKKKERPSGACWIPIPRLRPLDNKTAQNP